MKTKLITILLLLWAGVVWGQKNIYNKIEKIDLSKDKLIPGAMKKNSYIRIKLSDVNVFKVSGTSVTKVENIGYELPKWFTDKMANAVEPPKEEIINETMSVGNGNDRETKKQELENSYTHLQKNIRDNLTAFFREYQQIKSLSQLEDELNYILSDSIFVDSIRIVSNAQNIYFSHFNNFDSEYKDYVKIETHFNNFDNDFRTLISNYKGFEEISEKLKKQFSFKNEIILANTIYKKISENEEKIKLKAKNGISLYKQIITTDFFILLPAEQLIEDITTITPQLKNKEGKVIYSYAPLKIQTYGGWKINFSAGYFLSFISNDNYSTYTNVSGNKEVSKGNSDKVTHALGGLLHVYSNRPQWLVQPGFSFGLSLADNSSLGFYAGPSLFFLEKNRLVTTFGYSFLKVKRLNTSNLTAVQEPDKYAFVNIADTEIRYDNVYKGAWFFGVTYNLSK